MVTSHKTSANISTRMASFNHIGAPALKMTSPMFFIEVEEGDRFDFVAEYDP